MGSKTCPLSTPYYPRFANALYLISMQFKKRSKASQVVWKVLVIIVSLSMILALILPFVSLGY